MERGIDETSINCDNHNCGSSLSISDAASSLNSCSQMFIEVFQANEENATRRLKEKSAEE